MASGLTREGGGGVGEVALVMRRLPAAGWRASSAVGRLPATGWRASSAAGRWVVPT